jgi:D-arabinose 1-dehydrogenase-like Zn-dependent alcohol dehydrogenase
MNCILVLGATGRVGHHIVDTALSSGYEVTALVRNPGKLETRPNLTAITGTAESFADVNAAMQGVSGVVVVLNNARAFDSPWGQAGESAPPHGRFCGQCHRRHARASDTPDRDRVRRQLSSSPNSLQVE